jgi:hypothetical protein
MIRRRFAYCGCSRRLFSVMVWGCATRDRVRVGVGVRKYPDVVVVEMR